MTPATPPPQVQDTEAPVDTKDPWLGFVYKVRKANGLLGAMLENTHILEQTNERITIGVPKKVAFMIDKIKDPDNVRRVEQFIETFWQKTLKVEIKMDDGTSTVGALTPRAKEEKAKVERTQSIESAVEENPLVRSAKNVFKTQVKTIREPNGSSQSKESKS